MNSRPQNAQQGEMLCCWKSVTSQIVRIVVRLIKCGSCRCVLSSTSNVYQSTRLLQGYIAITGHLNYIQLEKYFYNIYIYMFLTLSYVRKRVQNKPNLQKVKNNSLRKLHPQCYYLYRPHKIKISSLVYAIVHTNALISTRTFALMFEFINYLLLQKKKKV